MSASALLQALRRPVVLLGTLIGVVAVVVWLVAFFVPQGHKLSNLSAKEASLRASLTADEARLQRLRLESKHATQIEAIYQRLQTYAPETEQIYTYITVINTGAKQAGVTLASLAPGAAAPLSGTAYEEVPIGVSVSGTYDHILNFVRTLYGLPRLTDIESVSVVGGGPATSRATVLSASFQCLIFFSTPPKSTAGGTGASK